MSRRANVQEAENGYTCNMTTDDDYNGETHIAKNMDEVHEHLKKHFAGKEKKKEPKKGLGSLARH